MASLIDKLPNELLGNTFQFLTALEAHRASQVNRAFYEASKCDPLFTFLNSLKEKDGMDPEDFLNCASLLHAKKVSPRDITISHMFCYGYSERLQRVTIILVEKRETSLQKTCTRKFLDTTKRLIRMIKG